MKRKFPGMVLVIGFILLVLSVFTFFIPFLLKDIHGSIEVNWANPVGLKIERLEKGDNFDLVYSSEINVSMYLLTREQANEYRSAAFYKEPLPDPLISGKEGQVSVEIKKDGDYELLFLAEEPARTFSVDYQMERSFSRERSMFIFSGIGLLLSSLIFLILGIVLLLKEKKPVICK